MKEIKIQNNVKKKTDELKSNKAVGPDMISSNILILFGENVTEVKEANVIQLYKSGKTSDMNYNL